MKVSQGEDAAVLNPAHPVVMPPGALVVHDETLEQIVREQDMKVSAPQRQERPLRRTDPFDLD